MPVKNRSLTTYQRSCFSWSCGLSRCAAIIGVVVSEMTSETSDRRRQRDRELAEQAADDSRHQQNRNEHRDQRDADRDDGETDPGGALDRGFERRHPLLAVARNVFDDDDRVVDHEAGGNRQRHQRQIVEAVAEQVHDAEGADQRERNDDARDQRGAQITQEQEHHHDHQRDRDQHRELDVVHRGADGGGAVHARR